MARTTRKDILDAAIREFARCGFSGASTLVIAKSAKTKQPLLNYHFGSKEKLWQAAVDFGLVELTVAFEAIRDTACDMSAINILKLMLRTLNRFATRHPLHVDILRQEMGSTSTRSEYLLKNYLGPVHRDINEVVGQAVEAGAIKPMPPAFLSSLLMGAVTHYFTAGPTVAAVYSLDVADPKQAKRHGDWIVEAIFEGITIKPGD
jgi:TetR/AcrR family transcriptional regulator